MSAAEQIVEEARQHYDSDHAALAAGEILTGDVPVAGLTGDGWCWPDGTAYTEAEERAIVAEYRRLVARGEVRS